mmetsp:Transcript_59262/g.130140  ORF Transcript_59262/g.130140 Transcript_59262/m.130140 type:complete len:285 (+) Transcript_59262:1090-1944(+)
MRLGAEAGGTGSNNKAGAKLSGDTSAAEGEGGGGAAGIRANALGGRNRPRRLAVTHTAAAAPKYCLQRTSASRAATHRRAKKWPRKPAWRRMAALSRRLAVAFTATARYCPVSLCARRSKDDRQARRRRTKACMRVAALISLEAKMLLATTSSTYCFAAAIRCAAASQYRAQDNVAILTGTACRAKQLRHAACKRMATALASRSSAEARYRETNTAAILATICPLARWRRNHACSFLAATARIMSSALSAAASTQRLHACTAIGLAKRPRARWPRKAACTWRAA